MLEPTFPNLTFLWRRGKWITGILIILLMGFLFMFDMPSALSPGNLEKHHALVRSFAQDHRTMAVLLYFGLYCFLAVFSLPGKFFLALLAGYLFGAFWGTVYILSGATAGAALAFVGTRYLFREIIDHRFGPLLPSFQDTMKSDAFLSLLILRLLPMVPFGLLNVLAGLTSMKFNTFLRATLIGMLPCTFVLSYTGSRLSQISGLSTWETSSPIVPLTGLTILVLMTLACYYLTLRRKRISFPVPFFGRWSGQLCPINPKPMPTQQ